MNDFYTISIPFDYYGAASGQRNGAVGAGAPQKSKNKKREEDARTKEYLKNKYAIYEEYSFYEVKTFTASVGSIKILEVGAERLINLEIPVLVCSCSKAKQQR